MLNYKAVLEEMLKSSAKKIHYNYNSGAYELVAAKLLNEFEIDLDEFPEGPASWEMMSILAESVREWEEETKKNFEMIH